MKTLNKINQKFLKIFKFKFSKKLIIKFPEKQIKNILYAQKL